ncbi:MAG: hypothetical protein E7H05_03665 [Veillonella sp.]|nr:hypothetical protein [Veillonella sp.]
MNNKEFTDYLFKIMHELGYRKAEVAKGSVFFYKCDILVGVWTPRMPVELTCFVDEPQCIDIAEYLGIVDWSKVKVDTPILVRDFKKQKWERRYFAKVENDKIYAWDGGATSWSVGNGERCFTSWRHAKLAEV